MLDAKRCPNCGGKESLEFEEYEDMPGEWRCRSCDYPKNKKINIDLAMQALKGKFKQIDERFKDGKRESRKDRIKRIRECSGRTRPSSTKDESS